MMQISVCCLALQLRLSGCVLIRNSLFLNDSQNIKHVYNAAISGLQSFRSLPISSSLPWHYLHLCYPILCDITGFMCSFSPPQIYTNINIRLSKDTCLIILNKFQVKFYVPENILFLYLKILCTTHWETVTWRKPPNRKDSAETGTIEYSQNQMAQVG